MIGWVAYSVDWEAWDCAKEMDVMKSVRIYKT